MPMPRLTSPHDDTPDAREALWNRYYASQLLKKLSRSTSGSRSSSSKKGSSMRRGNAQQGNAVPVPRPPSKGARALGVEAYENPKPRPLNLAPETLWFGNEPDVQDIFNHWDERVPTGAIHKCIQEFEAAKELGTMLPQSKAALVDLVAHEMWQGHLSPSHAKPLQIQYFLSQRYREMVKEDPRLAVSPGGHWILGSIRDRTGELEWLKFQAGIRWWKAIRKGMEAIDPRRMTESLECEVNAMLDSYTHHSELP